METAKAMQILQEMVGNTYEYEEKKVLVYDARIKGNIASLITDKDVIELPIDGLEDYLDDFKFIKTNQLIRSPEVVEMVVGSGGVYKQLQETLLASIEKVKTDSGYIAQAQTINDTVKQVIDLEKVKIQAISLLK